MLATVVIYSPTHGYMCSRVPSLNRVQFIFRYVPAVCLRFVRHGHSLWKQDGESQILLLFNWWDIMLLQMLVFSLQSAFWTRLIILWSTQTVSFAEVKIQHFWSCEDLYPKPRSRTRLMNTRAAWYDKNCSYFTDIRTMQIHMKHHIISEHFCITVFIFHGKSSQDPVCRGLYQTNRFSSTRRFVGRTLSAAPWYFTWECCFVTRSTFIKKLQRHVILLLYLAILGFW